MNTSVSDNAAYPAICIQASQSEEAFKTFKSNKAYTDILEHVTYEEGQEYAALAFKNKEIEKNIIKFSCNDIYGSPRTFTYSFGTFSPTTLRYMKVLSDLAQLKLDNTTIVEIGAGYGGQYAVLRQLFKPKKYIFVDLPEALALIKTYITKLGLDDIEIEYYDTTNIKNINADLVISNYAFSECTEEIQDIYLNSIINRSKHGYIIHNNMRGYAHTEFIEKCTNKIKLFPEIPQTHPKNVLLVW
jgi:putative sugar O-methyltransferase